MKQNQRMRSAVVVAGLLAMAMSDLAAAQWVMLARHVVGRVERMSQQSKQDNGPSYDSAVVMLEAPPDKVYAAVLNGVRNAQGITITREDPASSLVQFTNGQQIAGIKVSPVGDKLTHLLVSSAHTGDQPNAAGLVLNAVLRVCKDMNVECSQARQ